MASPSSAPLAAERRVQEKEDSRRKDVHALVTRQTTFAQLGRENTPITLSGERIDFSRLTSDI